MSHSYRKPYSSACGYACNSADKRMAARGVRRTQNVYLRTQIKYNEFDDFLIPHRLESPWNNTYSWSSDGLPHLLKPISLYFYGLMIAGDKIATSIFESHKQWYERIQRK